MIFLKNIAIFKSAKMNIFLSSIYKFMIRETIV